MGFPHPHSHRPYMDYILGGEGDISLPRVGVAIMAHPKRKEFVPSILDRLDAEATVVWDRYNDRHETGSRAMLAYKDDFQRPTHWLVIQDDAVVPRNLVAALTRALEHTGGHPLGLYIGNVRAYERLISRALGDREVSWLRMPGPKWGVGVCIPTCLIDDMVAWGDRQNIENYDRRMAHYLTKLGLLTLYPWPSLVDHRVGHESLVPGRTGERHAMNFIGEDALDFDPTGEVANNVLAVFRSRSTGQMRAFDPDGKDARKYERRSDWVRV